MAHGFYALGMSATETKHLAGAIIHSAEDRAYVPFIYLNYIAMREELQNQKVGTMLLMNALTRCAQVARNIGVYGVALNALTQRAGSLYEKFGFRAHDDKKFPLMILPARSLFELVPAPKA